MLELEWELLQSLKEYKLSNIEYNLAKNNSCLEILGKKFSLESIKELLYILEQIKKDKKLSECIITGNFDTYFQTKEFYKKNSISEIKQVLSLFQLITKTIENSHINFVCEVNSTMQGPALELALSCNIIKANNNVMLKFEEADNGTMPLFGSIQRLLRIIGYKNTLDTLLMKKFLSYKDAESLNIINYNNKNQEHFKRNIFFWDQSFTNTFIFYNSKLHAKTKNKLPAYNAILSCIYEGAICGYEAALSVEKRWLLWLLNHKSTIAKFN